MQEQFQIPIIFDLGATFVFGITGALAALRRGYDVVGLFALAFASGVGGGLLRDGLFIQNGPAVITQNSQYIIVIALSAVAAAVPAVGRFYAAAAAVVLRARAISKARDADGMR